MNKSKCKYCDFKQTFRNSMSDHLLNVHNIQDVSNEAVFIKDEIRQSDDETSSSMDTGLNDYIQTESSLNDETAKYKDNTQESYNYQRMNNKSELKKRGPNFTPNDKSLLLSLLAPFVHILENKKIDSITNEKKNIVWKKITTSFNAKASEQRTVVSLRKFFEKIKSQVRKSEGHSRMEDYLLAANYAKAEANIQSKNKEEVKELLMAILNKTTTDELSHSLETDFHDITEVEDSKNPLEIGDTFLTETHLMDNNVNNVNLQRNSEPTLSVSTNLNTENQSLKENSETPRTPDISNREAPNFEANSILHIDFYEDDEKPKSKQKVIPTNSRISRRPRRSTQVDILKKKYELLLETRLKLANTDFASCKIISELKQKKLKEEIQYNKIEHDLRVEKLKLEIKFLKSKMEK